RTFFSNRDSIGVVAVIRSVSMRDPVPIRRREFEPSALSSLMSGTDTQNLFVGPRQAPSYNRSQYRLQRPAPARQAVFDARRTNIELLPLNETPVLQLPELPAENARGHRLAGTSFQHRIPDLAIAVRTPPQDPQDSDLVFAAADLTE